MALYLQDTVQKGEPTSYPRLKRMEKGKGEDPVLLPRIRERTQQVTENEIPTLRGRTQTYQSVKKIKQPGMIPLSKRHCQTQTRMTSRFRDVEKVKLIAVINNAR